MSDWTSINEIMRDLSVAQGRVVPVSLEAFGDCAPPTANIEEETEEEYFKPCGDIDFSKPPDFTLIQEMLTMVRHDESEPEKEDDNDILLNSNLNPLSVEFIPGKKCAKQSMKKPRRERNVAIESIIQALKEHKETQSNDKHSTEMLKSPLNMFKSKYNEEQRNIRVTAPQSVSVNSNREYTPSVFAQVYYNKYVENEKSKKQVTEDLWTKAEQNMKELNKRQLARVEQSPTPSSSASAPSDSCSVSSSTSSSCFKYGLYRVALQHYRHFSTEVEKCVVCEVAAKHGYHIEDEE